MCTPKRVNASVIDLFCGVGGLTHGFVQEGFNVVAGVDNDPSCRYAYETNNSAPFILGDVQNLPASELSGLYPPGQAKVLVGCAPCTPFSQYANGHPKDEKWTLLRSFARLAKELSPDIVSMENVPQLRGHSTFGVFDEFVDSLQDAGFDVFETVVYCPDYGIPQTRERLVLLASRFGKLELNPPSHTPDKYVTVRKAIGHLHPLSAGQVSASDPVHRARGLTEINLRRIAATPPGGSWRDWPPELILECHKRASGQTYPSVYGRIEWDKPGPTITTHCAGLGNGRFGHPDQDRAISLREAALLQSFPENYAFIDPDGRFSSKSVARHIGNAVPVRLARVIARSISDHLDEFGPPASSADTAQC